MTSDILALKGSGQILENVHKEDECAGGWCTIHNLMPGPWQDWPMRYVAGVVMVRTCPHGVAHPAIEDVVNLRTHGVTHTCDGCDCGVE